MTERMQSMSVEAMREVRRDFDLGLADSKRRMDASIGEIKAGDRVSEMLRHSEGSAIDNHCVLPDWTQEDESAFWRFYSPWL
jgi:hypothetical protein